MDSRARDAVEQRVRRLCTEGELAAAATAAVRGYGPEIYGLLRTWHREEADAADVFSTFSENLWQGLPTFVWQCTLRTWAYTLARNASFGFLRGVRRNRRGVPLSEASAAGRLAYEIRTETRTWMRTETKDRFALLRESLPPEDQTLLVLRVDRNLEWNELARIFSDKHDPDDQTIKREAARLRKRFQLIKEQLRDLARREGLLPAGDD